MRVGFIGLGRMGRPMAERLAASPHELFVCDVRADIASAAASAWGAKSVASPAEVAARAEIVLISLPGVREDTEVMEGPHGVLVGVQPGLIVADTTTCPMPHSQAMAKRAAATGVVYLDTPVSRGGVDNLIMMAGGDAAAVERARPVLEVAAKHVVYAGPSGHGSAIKHINQAVYISFMAAFAEGLALGEGLGIPLETLLDALGPASAGSPLISTKFEEIRGLADKRFAIDSAVRYFGMTEEAFRSVDRATPIFKAAAQSMRQAAQRGVGDEDLVVARRKYLAK